MKVVTLKAQQREPDGTAGARRARREGRLPAVIYGEGEQPRHISIDTHGFGQAVDHGARVIDLEFEDDGETRVLLKELQYDALGAKMLHADFLRLSPNTKIELAVPLDLRGTPKALAEGGVLTVLSATVALRCLPKDIPEEITVEVAGMGMGDSIHAADVTLPENVELAVEPDTVLLSITVPRGIGADEDEEDEGEELLAEGAEAAEGDATSDEESGE